MNLFGFVASLKEFSLQHAVKHYVYQSQCYPLNLIRIRVALLPHICKIIMQVLGLPLSVGNYLRT